MEWVCERVSVDGEPADVSDWNVKKTATCIVIEVRITESQQIEQVKIDYDGASFVEIECCVESDQEWKIMLPRATLRIPPDVNSKMNETNRSKTFTKNQFTKSIPNENIQKLRVKLEQPFDPQCKIGLTALELSHTCSEIKNSPQKSTFMHSILKQDPPPTNSPTKSAKPISSLISELTAKSTRTKILHGMVVVFNANGPESKKISEMITELGGTASQALPSKSRDVQWIVVLGDLFQSNISSNTAIVVKSDWVKECYKADKRLPLSDFSMKSPARSVGALSPVPAPQFRDESSEEEDTDIMDLDRDLNFEAATEDIEEDDWEVLTLPTFLSGICVGISEEISEAHKKMLSRYIIAYGGIIVENWEKNFITHFLRESPPPWPVEFKKAIQDHPFGNFAVVSPEWIVQCHNSLSLLIENEFLMIA